MHHKNRIISSLIHKRTIQIQFAIHYCTLELSYDKIPFKVTLTQGFSLNRQAAMLRTKFQGCFNNIYAFNYPKPQPISTQDTYPIFCKRYSVHLICKNTIILAKISPPCPLSSSTPSLILGHWSRETHEQSTKTFYGVLLDIISDVGHLQRVSQSREAANLHSVQGSVPAKGHSLLWGLFRNNTRRTMKP